MTEQERSAVTNFIRVGNMEGGIDELRRLVYADPADAEAHLMLADILTKRGSLADARQHYETAAAEFTRLGMTDRSSAIQTFLSTFPA